MTCHIFVRYWFFFIKICVTDRRWLEYTSFCWNFIVFLYELFW